MNYQKNLIAIAVTVFLALVSVVAEASNVHVVTDAQEITGFLSGYDISTVTFTLDENDILTIEIKPFGVPGDADGDGNPDASSNLSIVDGPGVGSLEFLNMGMNCADPASCFPPEATITYTNNTLTVSTPPGVVCNASMVVTPDAYVLTIPDFSVVKAAAGGTSTSFSAFSFSASFSDNQQDDLAPDADPATGLPACEQINLEPPVAGNDPFDCYAVNKVKVEDKAGTDKDKIKVSKAGFRLDSPNTVDLATDMVQIRIDGLAFDFVPGSFVQKGNKPDYQFKSASGVKPKIEARLRFDKAQWEIKVSDGDASLIDNSDGVDVALVINGFEGMENVLLDSEGKYTAHPKISCRHVTSDSSDSGTPGENKLSCLSSMTVEHVSGRLITKTSAAGELMHPTTAFTDETTGDIGIFHTSCSQCLQCGDVNGNFTIMEIDGLPGDKMSQKCVVPDASCSNLIQ